MSRFRRGIHADLAVELGPLTLPCPIIAASGTFGHGAEVARLGRVDRLGAVTVKSLSAEPWAGNPPPRVHESPAGMLNSIGLQNPGAATWVRDELPDLLDLGARVIVSIWGRSVDEFVDAARAVRPAFDDPAVLALEVNLSCPNLEGRSTMFAHSMAATAAVIRAVAELVAPIPVFAKLSPNTSELVEIAGAALDAGATGLTLVNTLLGLAIDPDTGRFRLGNRGGGLSGPAMHPVAVRAVYDVTRARPGTPIIGTGGVFGPGDAVEMMRAGASAVGMGTATFLDPRAPERLVDGLDEWLRRRQLNGVAELIGACES